MTNTKQCQNCKWFVRMAPEQGNCTEGGKTNRVDMLFTCEKFEPMHRERTEKRSYDGFDIPLNDFEKIAFDVAETLTKKNLDYGDSFHKRYLKHGDLSAFIRMEDKWGRLDNMVSVQKMEVDEAMIDTLKDLAGYSILWLKELLDD